MKQRRMEFTPMSKEYEVTVDIKKPHEVVQWCKQNLSEQYVSASCYEYGHAFRFTVVFSNMKDATLFRLFWSS